MTYVPLGLVGDHAFPMDFCRGPQTSRCAKLYQPLCDRLCSLLTIVESILDMQKIYIENIH